MLGASNRVTGRRRIATGLVLSGVALVTAIGAPAFAADSSAPAPAKVTVKPAQVFTSTGIQLKAGETVTITSSGRIHFGGGKIASLTPAGIKRGADCNAIANVQPRSTPWPAPSASCWSLIGQVRGGKIFEVGLKRAFQPQVSGELLLGVNDNFVSDNSGSWAATVEITPPASTATTPSTVPSTTAVPAATTTGGKGKSSSSPLFLIIGIVVALVALFLLWRFLAGRRKPGEPAEPEPAPAPLVAAIPGAPNPYASIAAKTEAEPQPEPEPFPAAVVAPPIPATPDAPPEPESIDVNIFEVEFTNGLTRRVGYNHFPEGTTLRWKVTQNRIPVSSGHFVTKGGGSTNHVETVPLGVKLEGRDARPDGADVQFDWSINGVPFRYSVRRDPNC